MEIEHVFKALADHHRRHLLELLSGKDGQTLTELCASLPMTRFGAMKHLRVLEEAGLITTQKAGREKRHYLASDPIKGVAEWAEQYRKFWEERMDHLGNYLQQQTKEQTNDYDTE